MSREYTPCVKTRFDLTGVVFGRLTVVRLLGSHKNNHYWLCKCACGNTSEVPTGRLRSGNTSSCGCLTTENSVAKSRTHGMSRTPMYGMWHRMIQRCEDENCNDYIYYGGRGIVVCPEWHDFATFLKDVGERQEGLTLDRIDNNAGYEPGNVRWVTRAEQMVNTRGCRFLEHEGQTKTVSEWAREKGVQPRTLNARLNLLGYTVEEALSKPVKPGEMLNGRNWRGNRKDVTC